ncbi:MAG: ATP-binding protein [Lachnospiraceae bacterium]|nr:ATP-binding protein [Lachnospiraceae bacterium]
MKAIKIGNRVEIYNDMVRTFDELPPKAYIVRFAKLSGFYLEEYAEIELKEEKIYGGQPEKVRKVLEAYRRSDRNLGVILSGDKGIGKTLFARFLAVEAIKQGIPVLVVDRYIPGIASYLEKPDQRVMLLFDEFDKTFAALKPRDAEQEPQAELLGLFDGISQGKKLFVITCNEVRGLSDCILNRPGRFHYHFRFDYPSEEEIRGYLADKLEKKYYGEIDTIVEFSRKVDLNYDCLRAIAMEVNGGEKFAAAIPDLNILNLAQDKYKLDLHFKGGEIIGAPEVQIDFFSDDEKAVNISEDNYNEIISVHFYTQDCEYDMQKRYAVIPAERLRLTYDEDYGTELVNKMKALVPDYLTIKKIRNRSLHYAV